MDNEVGGEVGLEGCAADGEGATDEGVGDEEAGEVGEAVPADGEADAGDGEGDGVEGVEHGSSVPLMVVGYWPRGLRLLFFFRVCLNLRVLALVFLVPEACWRGLVDLPDLGLRDLVFWSVALS